MNESAPVNWLQLLSKIDHQDQLNALLNIAKSLNFTIPSEGATHLHFEAFEFHSAHIIRNIVNLFGTYDELLMVLFKTNHKCIRLGRWHQSIFELVEKPWFPTLSWQQVKDEFKRLPLTKYCNYNLINIIHDIQEKPTFEVRILPCLTSPGKKLASRATAPALRRWPLALKKQPA